jgi:Carbohydrate family 9 binding domain-like
MRTLVAAGLIAWVACVDQGSGSGARKVDPKYVAEHLLTVVPTGDVERVDVSIGGKVVYVGSAIGKPTDKTAKPPDKPAEGSGDSPPDKPSEPESRAVAPGEMMRITHYWQVVKPVGVGWRVFAFLRGAPNTADFMNLPPTDMQIAHGPALWKAGEIIADVQDIPLRADWRSPTATLYVGLIAIGEHGVGDRMVASGAHTLDRAVIARVIDVDVSKAPPPPGTVYVPHATEHNSEHNSDIMLDGVASEPAWATAATSAEFVAAEGSGEPPGKATARLIWDDQFLYAFVSVVDSDVASPYKNHDDPLWKADCVELFIDADRNGRGYVELQVNPNNATFDSWFETTRVKPGDPSWESGMQTAVKVRGTPEPGGTDQGWDAEIAIPWPAVRGRDAAMAVTLPPRVGDRWRLNIVRVDLKTGDKKPTASSWNRITYSDFHALDRMLNVVFADARGSIAAQPTGATKSP